MTTWPIRILTVAALLVLGVWPRTQAPEIAGLVFVVPACALQAITDGEGGWRVELVGTSCDAADIPVLHLPFPLTPFGAAPTYPIRPRETRSTL